MIHFSILKKISTIIFTLHLFIIVWAIFVPIEQNKKKSAPIVVRSIIEEPKITPAVKALPNKALPEQAKNKKVQQAKVKKVTPSNPRETKKVTRSVNKPALTSSDTLFVPKLSSEAITPQPQAKIEKISFEEILQFLESMIILPVKSAIKAKITIQPDGKIKEITVLEGDIENKNYLVQTLEGYLLPIDTACQYERELIINFRGL